MENIMDEVISTTETPEATVPVTPEVIAVPETATEPVVEAVVVTETPAEEPTPAVKLQAPSAGNTVESLLSRAAHEVAAEAQGVFHSALDVLQKAETAVFGEVKTEETQVETKVAEVEAEPAAVATAVEYATKADLEAIIARIEHFNTRSGQKI